MTQDERRSGGYRRGRVIETVGKITETYAARSLQGRASAGYDESSVSDITHSVGVMTFGAPHVGRQEAGRQGVGRIWPPITPWEVVKNERPG